MNIQDDIKTLYNYEAFARFMKMVHQLREESIEDIHYLDVETGGTFDFKQKQKGGNGYGLFQFDFHKPYYKKFLKDNELEDSVDSQVRYTFENIYGNQQEVLGEGNAEKLRNSFKTKSNPIELSDDIMNIFLRPGKPHADRRRESTRMYSSAITPAK